MEGARQGSEAREAREGARKGGCNLLYLPD